MKNKLALLALVTTPFFVVAEEAKSPWKASAELGALYKTGTTKAADILAGFDASYEKGQWKNAVRFDLLVSQSESTDADSDELETTDQEFKINFQTNYTLSEEGKNYIYGNFEYEDDRFSGFQNQWSLSSGWGRRWYESKDATLDADIGPGFKRDTEDDGTKNDSFIVQGQLQYNKKFNENVNFQQLVIAKWAPDSDENSQYKTESSITANLVEALSLKFTFAIDHNTEVGEGIENTDTQTGITLVYTF